MAQCKFSCKITVYCICKKGYNESYMTLFLNLFLLLLLFNPGSLWGQPAPTYLDANMLIFGYGGGFKDKSSVIETVNQKPIEINGDYIAMTIISQSVPYIVNDQLTDYVTLNEGGPITRDSDHTNMAWATLVSNNFPENYILIGKNSGNNTIAAYATQNNTEVRATLNLQSNNNGGVLWLGTISPAVVPTRPVAYVFNYNEDTTQIKRVGILTPTPRMELHVEGDIVVDGDLIGHAVFANSDLDYMGGITSGANCGTNWTVLKEVEFTNDYVNYNVIVLGMAVLRYKTGPDDSLATAKIRISVLQVEEQSLIPVSDGISKITSMKLEKGYNHYAPLSISHTLEDLSPNDYKARIEGCLEGASSTWEIDSNHNAGIYVFRVMSDNPPSTNPPDLILPEHSYSGSTLPNVAGSVDSSYLTDDRLVFSNGGSLIKTGSGLVFYDLLATKFKDFSSNGVSARDIYLQDSVLYVKNRDYQFQVGFRMNNFGKA